MIDDIVAFIRARLDEDWADFEPWVQHDEPHVSTMTAGQLRNYQWNCRMLRGVEAKQRIVARHHPFTIPGHVGCRECSEPPVFVDYPCDNVRDIASEWSDHPGYRQEWAP